MNTGGIVGINEIAEIAGVTKQAVANWRARGNDFPQPLATLASGPIFQHAEVTRWLRGKGYSVAKPGFYARLRDNRSDDDQLQACIERVVGQLEQAESPNRPGMLLGKIQSGKTRAFLGVIASSFDRGYDVAIVLTKGTKTLASQTVKRIGRDFKSFIDQDEVAVFDVMSMPERLTPSELRRKLIFVGKKQVHNLDRIQKLFTEKYPELRGRKILLIDDEADLASIRFTKKKGETDYDQGAIANRMDDFRAMLEGHISFLQVTATPYALYLQPDGYEESTTAREVFSPKRPAFTELLPIHDAYVGGDDYFGGFEQDDPRHYLYVEVADRELDALRSNDGRAIRADRLWLSDNIRLLRRSLISFLLSVAIRRCQQREEELPLQKYAMIIHNDTQKSAHEWQWQTVNLLIDLFSEAAAKDDPRLRILFDEAFADISRSLTAYGASFPSSEECYSLVKQLIADGELNVERVNSDMQLEPLLNSETAELRLRTQANLFIGGSILDRGITVPNLLAFYYGRNPRRMQADTVLQHSRMYGARDRLDLAVTRFYTSRGVYNRLAQIHRVETALREALGKGIHHEGVIFIQKSADNRVVPCAPNKVALSDLVAVRANDFLLPTSFNTLPNKHLRKIVDEIDRMIPAASVGSRRFVEVPLSRALALIDAIEPSLVLEEDASFEWGAMRGLLRYYAEDKGDKVLILAETGRRLSKTLSGDKSGLSIIGTALRDIVRTPSRAVPALILLRQDGGGDLGWNGGPFWWPVFASPSNTQPCVFATKCAA